MTAIFRLPEALAAWGTANFIALLKHDVGVSSVVAAALAKRRQGFGTLDDPITVMVLGVDDQGDFIEARISLLYTMTETIYRCPDGIGEEVVHGACAVTLRIERRTAVGTLLFHAEDE